MATWRRLQATAGDTGTPPPLFESEHGRLGPSGSDEAEYATTMGPRSTLRGRPSPGPRAFTFKTTRECGQEDCPLTPKRRPGPLSPRVTEGPAES